MSRRHAVVDVEPDPVEALTRQAAEGDHTARVKLVEAIATRDAARTADTLITKEQTRQKTQREAQARDAEQTEQRERGVAIATQRRTLAHELETDFAAGTLSLTKMRNLLALARDEYAATQSRAALACEERLRDWIMAKLDLPSPWVIPKARRRMTLAQALGLDPLDGQPEAP